MSEAPTRRLPTPSEARPLDWAPPPQGAGANLGGSGGLAVIGSLYLGAAVAMALLRMLDTHGGRAWRALRDLARPALAVAAAICLAWLAASWLRSWWRNRHERRGRRAPLRQAPSPDLHGPETWEWSRGRMLASLCERYGIAIFFVGWQLSFRGHEWFASDAVVVLVAGVPLVLLLYAAHQVFWLGAIHVRYTGAPYRPGAPVRFHLGGAGCASFGEMDLTLRCVKLLPKLRAKRDASGVTPIDTSIGSWRREVVYEQTRRVDEPHLLPEGDSEVEFTLDLPADGPPSDTSTRFQTWWEIEVAGRSWGVPIRVQFPLWVAPLPDGPAV